MGEVTAISIAKDFKIGNTRVKIATDFCETKSSEDVEKILERIAKTARQYLAVTNSVD